MNMTLSAEMFNVSTANEMSRVNQFDSASFGRLDEILSRRDRGSAADELQPASWPPTARPPGVLRRSDTESEPPFPEGGPRAAA
jgi:hypothetical protein